MGDELVRVERFEELRTGMRIAIKPCDWCGAEDVGVTGDFDPEVVGELLGGATAVLPAFLMIGGCRPRHWITRGAVREGIVYRFASDAGTGDQIAAEQNPYLARTVVGTGGREETRTLTRERGR